MHRGVLGGTFDPPHLAHLAAAEAAYHQLALDAVVFMPAGAPWQKAGEGVAAAGHRLAMTRRAVSGVDYFEVDDRELRRNGWTYTIDTLDSFPPAGRITLIMGADAARSVPTWHRAGDVLAAASIAVVPRPGVARDEVDATLAGSRVEWLDMPQLDLSSTDLRRRVSAGLSVRFLVPETVRRYIDEHSLYRDV